MNKKKPATGKTAKKLPTRQKIISSALALISEEGFVSVTVSKVAQTANIPHTLVLYHFPNIESLYLEIVQLILSELIEASVETLERHVDNPKEALRAYIEAPFHWASKPENKGKFAFWIHFYALAALPNRFQEVNSAIRKQGRDRLSAILYEGIAKKTFKAAPEQVPELAFCIQSLITGMAIQAASETGVSQTAKAKQTCAVVFRLLS